MKLTLSEALEMRCCNSRDGNRCSGSDCMAWRWSYIVDPTYKGSKSNFIPPPPPMVVSDKGYCGLVGRI